MPLSLALGCGWREGGGGGEGVREGIMEWVWVLVDFDENLDIFGEK